MTKRERQLVISTLGAVSFAICIVGTADLLITGRIYPTLLVLFLIVGLGGGPFVIPLLWEDLNSHKLPSNRRDEPDKPKP